jgi:hypothetical protein
MTMISRVPTVAITITMVLIPAISCFSMVVAVVVPPVEITQVVVAEIPEEVAVDVEAEDVVVVDVEVGDAAEVDSPPIRYSIHLGDG